MNRRFDHAMFIFLLVFCCCGLESQGITADRIAGACEPYLTPTRAVGPPAAYTPSKMARKPAEGDRHSKPDKKDKDHKKRRHAPPALADGSSAASASASAPASSTAPAKRAPALEKSGTPAVPEVAMQDSSQLSPGYTSYAIQDDELYPDPGTSFFDSAYFGPQE
jgi:hypothetical protein